MWHRDREGEESPMSKESVPKEKGLMSESKRVFPGTKLRTLATNRFQLPFQHLYFVLGVGRLQLLKVRQQRGSGHLVSALHQVNQVVEVDLGEGVWKLALHRLVLPLQVGHRVLRQRLLSERVERCQDICNVSTDNDDAFVTHL